MTATYRCCCGDAADCCKVWCDCPDEITVTLCKRYETQTTYACDMGNLQVCPIADGTVIGTRTRAVKVSNLKLVKVTGVVGDCSGCCKYVAATGTAQTGVLEAWDDSWYINCYEKDNDDCNLGKLECQGYLYGPLSGSSGTWTLTTFAASLVTECCDAESCQGQSIRAVLSITVVGGRTNATETTDCCTQLTTIGGMTVDGSFKYEWDCRHQTRWVGTCPCDLMEEPGKVTLDWSFWTGGCEFIQLSPCPCPTVGQLSYYAPDCVDDQVQPAITGCTETVSGVVCTQAGNNGAIESITGCG